MADKLDKVKQTSEELRQVLERLTTDQLRFVVARQEYSTDKDAAKAIGIKSNTVSQWKHKGAPIDDAVRLMAHDGLVTAQVIRRKSLAKAMAVKAKGLDSDNEVVAQRSSTEIIEWEMGKATQPTEGTLDLKVFDVNEWKHERQERLESAGGIKD